MNNNQTGFFRNLYSSILRHLKQLPFILWYPIAIPINIVYSIVSYCYSWIDDRFNTLFIRQKQLTKLIRKSVHSILTGHSNIMSTFWSYRVCHLFTLLLQFLSLLTTYAGFTFFLKRINPFAPLILAITVQGVFYYLINTRSSRKRDGGIRRWFLLAFLLCISTITSFVGVSNTIRSPIEDMKNTYYGYQTEHNEYLENQVSKITYFTQIDVENALNACQNIRDGVDGYIKTINQAKPDDNDISTSTERYEITGYDENNNPVFKCITDRIINTDLLNAKNSLETLAYMVDNERNQLQYNPSTMSAEDIYSAFTSETRTPQQENLYKDFINCLNEHDSLEQLLFSVPENIELAYNRGYHGPTQSSTINIGLFSAETMDKYNTKVRKQSDATLADYDNIVSNSNKSVGNTFKTKITNALNSLELLMVSPELSESETIRNTLNNKMTEAYNKLDSSGQNKLKEKYTESQIPSSQLYPFKYLLRVSDPDWGSSLLSILLAVSIDLLSLILSLTLIKRRDSVLYAKNHKENIRNREEILEDCYTYICLRTLENGKNNKEVKTTFEIQSFVANTIESTMADFLKTIHMCYIPDSLDSFGYISSSEIHNKFDDSKNLFQTLRLIHLIHPTYKSELAALLEYEFIGPNGDKSVLASYIESLPNELIYLVDNRLLMWHNENFSELLQSCIYSSDFEMSSRMIIPDF